MNVPGTPPQSSDPSGGGAQTPPRRGIPEWFWWLALILLAIWNIYPLFFLPGAEPSASLPYSAFVEQVRAGTVSSVTINGQNVTGTFKQPVAWPPAAANPAPEATSGTAPAQPQTYPASRQFCRHTTTRSSSRCWSSLGLPSRSRPPAAARY